MHSLAQTITKLYNNSHLLNTSSEFRLGDGNQSIFPGIVDQYFPGEAAPISIVEWVELNKVRLKDNDSKSNWKRLALTVDSGACANVIIEFVNSKFG